MRHQRKRHSWKRGRAILMSVVVPVALAGCEYLTRPALDHPPEGERWVCVDDFSGMGEVITLTREGNSRASTGEVAFGGIVHEAQFSIDGIERRWSWGRDGNGGFDYSLLIESSGDGTYYNFRGAEPGERRKPSQWLRCAQR